VAGGSKLKSVRMFRHMPTFYAPWVGLFHRWRSRRRIQ
jgi:hypothetical protein